MTLPTSPPLLAVETTAVTATVALYCDGVIDSLTLGFGERASAGLLGAIDQLLGRAGLRLPDCRALVCGVGPGAFTGVRLGLAVVKGLAYPHGIACVGVSSLANIAYQASRRPATAAAGEPSVGPRYEVLLDARMGDVYHARYGVDAGGRLVCEQEPSLLKLTDFRPVPGAIVCGALPEGFSAPYFAAYPLAAAALQYHLEGGGEREDAVAISPLYVRNQVAQTILEREAAHKNRADASQSSGQ